ncbi:MAG: asparagine synthase-related protein [bacterium]
MIDKMTFLKSKIKEIIQINSSATILFSGGLDTSIFAYLNPNASTITVSLENFGEDLKYSNIIKEDLNLKNHHHLFISIDEALSYIPEVIKILKTFDPAIPNDLVVYFALKYAKNLGIKKILTGDGADELFGGYEFMTKIENLNAYIEKLVPFFVFSSNELSNFFNIKIIQPYLNKEIIDFALNILPEFKIKDGYGKWILRKSFEDIIPSHIIWQSKRPLEYGSGMTKIREIISAKISDKEFQEKKNIYKIKFFNKEHLYYYEIYRKEVGEIPFSKNDENKCLGCGAGMNKASFHCKICGYVRILDFRLKIENMKFPNLSQF